MEAKYKILLGIYGFVMGIMVLIVPWWTPKGRMYSFVLQPPMQQSSIELDFIIANFVLISIVFGIGYFVLRKLN